MDHPEADFNPPHLVEALSESEELLRAIAQAMGWDHKPREEWVGIPAAIRARSKRLFAAEDRERRLERTIQALTAKPEGE